MKLLHACLLVLFAGANAPLPAQTTSASGSAPASQAGTIAGLVTGPQGEPLASASVVVVGTALRASTGADGRYTIPGVPVGTHQVRASLIGYAEEIIQGVSVRDGGSATANFRLQSQAIQLDEIVAVGYGTQRKRDLTGSVAAVDGRAIQSLPVTGADQALAGQVAGVHIEQSNGIPGGGPQIRVRGAGSIGAGAEPLYVVDGFALPSSTSEITNPLNDIAPADIASITILKDASATAIYGSRGSNGVVLIETKRGHAGSTRVEVESYMGVQRIPERGMPRLLNAREFAEFRREHMEGQIRYEQNREPTAADIPEVYRNSQQLGTGTNWVDAITREAPMYDVRVSLRGGANTLRAYVSANHTNQEGVVLGTDYTRTSLRANIDADLSERLQVGLNFAPSYSTRTQASVGGAGRYERGFGYALVASPLEPVYRTDGGYNPMIQSPGSFPYPNPVQALLEVEDSHQSLRALASGHLTYHAPAGLSWKTTANVDWLDVRDEGFHPSSVGELFRAPPVIPSGSYLREGYLNWLVENTMAYSSRVGASHHFDGVIGATAQRQLSTYDQFYGNDYPGDEVRTLNAAARVSGWTSEEEWALLSYFARLNYSYQDKYIVTGTIRRDGSSRFGSDNRWGAFPSLAVGWRVSEEPFMKSLSAINDLKLRASYGFNGNFNIGNYTYASQVGIRNYIVGNRLANGRTVNSLGNPELGWETTREIDLGLDVALLDDRLSLGVDVYRRTTEDMLLDSEVPQSSGYGAVTENRGKIRNQGIELSLATVNVNTDAFTWSTNFNLASNANRVLQLGEDGDPIITGAVNAGAPTHITQVGKPVGMFYGWKIAGVYQTEEEVAQGPAYPGAIPGNIKPVDVNGDGKLTRGDDFTILGSPYPDFVVGLTNSLTFRNFDVRVLTTASYGGARMRGANEWLWNIDGVFNVTKDYFDNRWISPEQPGDGKTPSPIGPSAGRIIYRDPNSLWIQDNSHIWIKNVTLGYTLPERLFRQFVQNGRIYVSFHNPLLITGYDGGNPEATNYRNWGGGNDRLTPGIDFSTYPVPSTLTVGTQLTF